MNYDSDRFLGAEMECPVSGCGARAQTFNTNRKIGSWQVAFIN
jgi:hypothetical protein